MKTLTIILAALLLFSCGREREETKPSDDTLAEIQLLREQTRTWANTCDVIPAFDDCNTGDSMLWTGLSCLSGEKELCARVREFQSEDGRLWRSPQRKNNDNSNSFSRDMLLGFLAYLVKTHDRQMAESFPEYLRIKDNRMCPGDLRCVVTPTAWGTMREVWLHIGLPPSPNMIAGNLGDETTLIAEAQTASTGYPLHLVGVKLWLKQHIGVWSPRLQFAADTIQKRQPKNPFYAFIAGDKNKSARLLIEQAPTSRPARLHQWSWQRDEKESAWNESFGWDVIFMANILLTP